MTFSPLEQNTVWEVQTRLREIDMALHPSLKSSLGATRTFAYSTLAGCCQFLDTVQIGGYSNEVESFAKEVVAPVVEECFTEMEKHSFQLNNETLKLKLVEQLRKIQQYPECNEFKKDFSPEVISKLQKILKDGIFSFYKLNEEDPRYYGGVLRIDDRVFRNVAEIMEDAGYKEEGDHVGSSFDVSGHVTTIFSRELSENYEVIINAHSEFVGKNEKASLKPVCISYGCPQSGILSKAVVVRVESPEIDAYRSACGLGKLFPPAHISVFSKTIKPLSDLQDKKITFFQFIDKETHYLSRFNTIFKSAAL